MVDVYHELSDPPASWPRSGPASKPEGRLVVVEFREEDPECRFCRSTR